jgi:hypothetical protein
MFPFISAAAGMGGPLGLLAANAVGTALGVDKPPADIEAAITAAQTKDPEAILKLRQAEQQFQLQMERLGFESVEQLEQIAAADRASARAREMSVRDKIPAVLAIAVTGGFFGLLALLIFHAIPVESREVLSVMTGALGTAWVSIVSYYFGSSSGSAAKTQLLAEQRK